jgi:hypothetical protein
MANQSAACDTNPAPQPHVTGREKIDAQVLAEADLAKHGNADATKNMLDEIHDLQKTGQLGDVAKDLAASGVKITYGKDGQVQEIVFDAKPGEAKSGSTPLDIDVAHDTVNGKSSDQLKDASVKQAKEFIAAALADPKADGGKPLSPEALAEANKLVKAMFDKDMGAVAKIAQEIMKDPKLTDSIGNALGRAGTGMGFSQDGSYLRLSDGSDKSVIVKRTGEVLKVDNDTLDPTSRNHIFIGEPYGKPLAAGDPFINSLGDQAIARTTATIQEAEKHLFGPESKETPPLDAYTNMTSLEQKYRKYNDDELQWIEKAFDDAEKSLDDSEPK